LKIQFSCRGLRKDNSSKLYNSDPDRLMKFAVMNNNNNYNSQPQA